MFASFPSWPFRTFRTESIDISWTYYTTSCILHNLWHNYILIIKDTKNGYIAQSSKWGMDITRTCIRQILDDIFIRHKNGVYHSSAINFPRLYIPSVYVLITIHPFSLPPLKICGERANTRKLNPWQMNFNRRPRDIQQRNAKPCIRWKKTFRL